MLEHRRDLLARLREVRSLEHLVAQRVDHAALLVHHVVVLERVLAAEVVLLLDLALGALDLLGEHRRLDRLLVALDVDDAELVEDAVDAVAGEQADQVVLGREEEARLAGVALAPGAPAQLVVDAPRLVALGAEDEEAARVEHALAVGGDRLVDLRQQLPRTAPRSSSSPGRRPIFASSRRARCSGLPPSLMSTPRPAMLVAIVTAPGRPASAIVSPSRSACSGRALRTWCSMPRRRRRSASSSETSTEIVPDEHGLAGLVARGDLALDRRPLAVLGLVDLIVAIGADHRAVRRDLHDRQLVDLHELGGLGQRRAGHPGELRVQAEVVLQRDRREGLVLLLDPHALLGLDGLVQALGPAPALERAAGELVDDLHLVVDHVVVDVALVERLRLERLDQVVDERAVLGAVEVVDAQEALGLGDADLGHRDRLVLLVELVVEVGHELLARPRVLALGRLARHHRAREARELDVELGRLLGGAADDQRRARLVDQDVVDLVDDREVVGGERPAVLVEAPAVLDLVLEASGHVVAQVVEAELGVGPVGHVAGVGVDLLGRRLLGLEHPDGDAEGVVERASSTRHRGGRGSR